MNDANLTKYEFHGVLPNGREGMVVALRLADITAAYRVLRAHANLRSFRPVAK